jgi:acid stress chaperone HdeB
LNEIRFAHPTGPEMTRWVSAFVLAAAFLPQSAGAEILDFGTVKCKDFLVSSKENIGYTLAWIDGYYQDEEESPMIDFDKLKENTAMLIEHCGKNPELGVGAAAEELFGK